MSAARSPARTLADWTARGKLISIRDILCLRRQPRKRPQDGLDVSGKTREPKHGPSWYRKRPQDGLDVSGESMPSSSQYSAIRKRPQDGLDVSGLLRDRYNRWRPDRKRPQDGLDVSGCRLTPMATGTTIPETT